MADSFIRLNGKECMLTNMQLNLVEFKILTYPVPLSLEITNLKSTEFKLAGFHFKTTLHWPGIYG